MTDLPELPPARVDPLDLMAELTDMITVRKLLRGLGMNDFIILDLAPDVTQSAATMFASILPQCLEIDVRDGAVHGLAIDLPQLVLRLTAAGFVVGRVPEGRADLYSMPDGSLLRTHPDDRCQGEFCCVHNPSAHPLNTAPLSWDGEKLVMSRMCAHDIAHPDPDHIAFSRAISEADATVQAEHTCDGCCMGVTL